MRANLQSTCHAQVLRSGTARGTSLRTARHDLRQIKRTRAQAGTLHNGV